MRFTKLEGAALIGGTFLGLAGFATTEPWIFFPCFGAAWVGFLCVCSFHAGSCLLRIIFALAITWVFAAISIHAYKSAAGYVATEPKLSKGFTPAEEPPPMTLDNVDALVRKWVASFDGIRNEIPNRPENYFTYAVSFGDGPEALIFRSRSENDRFITLQSQLSLVGNALAIFTKWPDAKKSELTNDLTIEASRARINCRITTHELPVLVTIRKYIHITKDVTDVTFFSTLHDIHSEMRLMVATLDKRFNEIDREALPSPKPNG